MTLIPKEPLFVGIEITPSSFKIAAIKKRGKDWLFPILQEIPLEEETSLHKYLPKDAIIVTSLSSREILMKNLTIAVKKEKEIKAAFEFQIEPLLPYSLEKSITQYTKIGEKEQGSILTTFSIKKEVLKNHLEHLKSFLKYDVDIVSAPAAALAALSTHFSQGNDPFFFMHLGKTEGTVVLIENGHLLAARHFEKDKVEIEKSILAILSGHKLKQVDTILLLCEENGWQEVIQKITGKVVLYPSFMNALLSDEQFQKFGFPIALALGATENTFPNFRQKEFKIYFPWRRLKKSIITFSVLFLLFFSGSYFLANTYLHKKEEALLKKFSHFFTDHEAYTLPQLHEKLVEIEKRIQESPDIFPLVPVVPKLGDFISWISSHPSQSQNGILIEDLRYQMVKRPDFSKQDEHYLVQVEMIFSANNPSAAETMRNLLSTPNLFVDTKKELEWTIEKGKYKAIFILKDKTHYY